MKTDVITVSGGKDMVGAVLEQADKYIAYKDLSGKDALHLRLLTEEMAGLMRAVTGENEGSFWIEDGEGEYQLHLQVRTLLNSDQREQLLSASTSGKNESARGLMGRLRDFFDFSADADFETYTSPLLLPDMLEHGSSPTLDWEWSMTQYERALYNRVEMNDPQAKEAWDELEQSVVKHVADDIRVSIRKGTAEMTIIKRIG